MRRYIGNAGFAAPRGRALGSERRIAVLAELATVAGLTISTIIAATVVSVGVARASVVDGVIGNEGSLFVIALLLGLIFIGVGGLSILPPRTRRH